MQWPAPCSTIVIMNSSYTSAVRHKAVWGPKRLVSALLVAVAVASPNIASANGRHRHFDRRKPGQPGKFVTFYKGLDNELSTRSKARNGQNFTTRVIVALKPGFELGREFQRT